MLDLHFSALHGIVGRSANNANNINYNEDNLCVRNQIWKKASELISLNSGDKYLSSLSRFTGS